MNTAKKIAAFVFVILVIVAGYLFANQQEYRPFTWDGDQCITYTQDCTCYGQLVVLESYPPQYQCSGINICEDINEIECRDEDGNLIVNPRPEDIDSESAEEPELESPQDDNAINQEPSDLAAGEGIEYTELPEYIPYTADLYNLFKGSRPFALFFHAAWCPTCIGMEKEITAELSSFPLGTKIFKVDYDSETALKKEYGIVTQSSVVILDANGNVTQTLIAPSMTQLHGAISASIQ